MEIFPTDKVHAEISDDEMDNSRRVSGSSVMEACCDTVSAIRLK